MSNQDPLRRLGQWLYWVAKTLQIMALFFWIGGSIGLAAIIGLAVMDPGAVANAPPTTGQSHGNETIDTIAGTMLLVSLVYELRALGFLAEVGKLLTTGEFLTDSLADHWWLFSRSITVSGVIELLAPRQALDCKNGVEVKYDYFPDVSNIQYLLITILCCYTIAFILREAARTKREAAAIKQENESFI